MRPTSPALAALLLAACSTTSYTRLAPVDLLRELGPAPTVPYVGPVSSDVGRVVLEVSPDHASVIEQNDVGHLRLACAMTPCLDDVAPGSHTYRLIPDQPTVDVQAGVVVSKDGVYPEPVEARVDIVSGETLLVRAALGQTEVRRAFPPGRAIGWTLFATGVAIAILGAATGASAPRGSRDGETATGLVELGVGVLTLGGALFLSNLNDNVTVRAHPGAARQWLAPSRETHGK
jgi:hypothetical protein